MSDQPTILNRVRYLLLCGFVLCMAGAFTATHVPGEDIPDIHLTDKSMHIIGFAGLGTAMLLTLAAFGLSHRRRIIAVATLLAIYGIIDENTQPYFGRGCDSLDWLADMFGIFIALTAWEYAFAARDAVDVARLRRLALGTLATAFGLIAVGMVAYYSGDAIHQPTASDADQYWSNRLLALGLYCLVLTFTNAMCLIMLTFPIRRLRWFAPAGAAVIACLSPAITQVTAGSILAIAAPIVAFAAVRLLYGPTFIGSNIKI